VRDPLEHGGGGTDVIQGDGHGRILPHVGRRRGWRSFCCVEVKVSVWH
jgi:hypothetical protein